MKRTKLLMLLALCLMLALPATAETTLRKTLPLQMEGQEEPYVVTLFRWEGVLSLWYGADHFAPMVTRGGLRFDLIDNQLGAPVYLDIEGLYDPTGTKPGDLEDVKAAYESDGWQVTPLDATGMLPDFHFAQEPPQAFTAQKDNQRALVLVTNVTSGAYAITIEYPEEAAEGWGARMAQMADTLTGLPGE